MEKTFIQKTGEAVGNIVGKAVEAPRQFGKSVNQRLNPKKYKTLDLIKESVNLRNSERNEYIIYQVTEKLNVSNLARKSAVTEQILKGNCQLYSNNNNVFFDTINSIIKRIVDEVIEDVAIAEITIDDKIVDPQIYVSSIFSNVNFTFDFINFKKMFKIAYTHGKCGVKVNVIDNNLDFQILEPYRYNISNSGKVTIFNSLGYPKYETEVRVFGGENWEIDGEESPLGNMFYELYIDSEMYEKLELLLAYDSIYSVMVKNAITSVNRTAYDAKVFGDNPYNQDTMFIVDMPKSEAVGQRDGGQYIQTLYGKYTLYELGNLRASLEDKIATTMCISKKAMGMDALGQDFASSLKYENDLTAKTVNSYRNQIENFVNKMLFDLLGQDIKINLGKYQLQSQEAIIDKNSKAWNSAQISMSEMIAERLGLDETDEKVVEKTIITKIEKNIMMTQIEEETAKKLGLMSDIFVDEETNESTNLQ